MSLREWCLKYNTDFQPTITGGKMITCPVEHPGNGELYHLTDHYVSSRTGPVLWLRERRFV